MLINTGSDSKSVGLINKYLINIASKGEYNERTRPNTTLQKQHWF